ncbi:MAG TPA: DUF6644 family protein [Azospirillaceae bacterium]|nr:DUF6644 family protein [Azospirillaceae bacterium]
MDGHGSGHGAAVGAAGWLSAIQASGLGEALRGSLWLYPLVEVVHVLASAILVGSILVYDLRVLGMGRAVPVAALARLALPASAGALAAAVITGAALFTAEATAYAANPAFLAKLGLIALGMVNVAWTHAGPMRGVDRWDTHAPAAARIGAGISLAVWTGTAAAGRLIAYL